MYPDSPLTLARWHVGTLAPWLVVLTTIMETCGHWPTAAHYTMPQ